MTNPSSPAPQDSIAEKAATLFERQRFGQWGADDQTELDGWLKESIFHEVAYLRLRGHVARADRLAALRPFRLDRPRQADSGSRGLRRFAFPMLAAASLALFATIAAPMVKAWLQPPDRSDSTDIGGRTLLSFADHTQIELNTDTVLRYRMTTSERTVWLEKGEAWFHVAHDAAHPFTVIVGKQRVTDLGTEFLIRRNAENVDVSVLSGRASLSREGVQTAMLTPGDEAIATPVSLSVTRKSPQELADELAWRRGVIVFRNATLATVVKEFNRYNATKLVIADPAIARETITANARTDDYESFLQMAQDLLKLRVEREGSVILISREIRKDAVRGSAGRRHD